MAFNETLIAFFGKKKKTSFSVVFLRRIEKVENLPLKRLFEILRHGNLFRRKLNQKFGK
jgi:hypothetical protein